MNSKSLTRVAAAAFLGFSLTIAALAVDSGGGGGGGGDDGGGGGGGSSNSSSSNSSASLPTLDDARDLIDAGRYSAAIRVLNDLVGLFPNDADVFNLMGYSLRKLQRYDQAEEFYLHALDLDPQHLGANEYLGELYVETGQLDKAQQRLAVLQNACGSCEEYDELAELIADAS
ncbi:MAG: tetratricopeptide repeat protein [Cucumibacter sp.]